MSTILTAKQAKLARESLRLSQGKVSSTLGINRTYLSLFESGKYIFDDQTLDELQLYYEGLGYDFEAELLDDNITAASNSLPAYPEEDSGWILEGGPAAPPPTVPEENHTALLAEYEANRRIIDELAAQEVDRGWFADWFDEPGEEEKLRLVTLMARNYSLHEEMQGRQAVQICDPATVDNEKDTIGEMVGVMFYCAAESR